MTHIAIIGAGITGVTTAYALARRGYSVTVIDRQRYAAMETSFANGGQLSACNAEVWNKLSTVLHGVQWMMRRDAPLLMNPTPSWHKLSWMAEFMRAIAHYRQNTVETVRLALKARTALFAMAEAEGIDFDLKIRGILHFYRDPASFEKAHAVNALLREGGLERYAVTPEEIRGIEPTLAGRYAGGYFTPSDAIGWRPTDRPSAAPQVLRADAVVICAGCASRGFAAMLGDRVNVYPVKGYSITVNLLTPQAQKAAPEVSILDEAAKIVTSRLGDERLRVAGTAEFNGFNRDIRHDRVQPLIDWTREQFPLVDTDRVVAWSGLRPMLPNMLPKVGRGRRPGVFYNTGHGHLGWTLSGATAELLAEAVAAEHAPEAVGLDLAA
jgi:D-amino-acid dehydrogenase